MPHLAGASCAVCRQPIRGFSDGAFCPECEAPVHQRCAQPPAADAAVGLCPRCGAPRSRGAEWARQVAESRRDKAVSGSRHELRRGLVFIGAGLMLSLICTVVSDGRMVVCGLPIMIGIVIVLIALWQWPRSVSARRFDEKDDYGDVDSRGEPGP